jgi:hypothetical protein
VLWFFLVPFLLILSVLTYTIIIIDAFDISYRTRSDGKWLNKWVQWRHNYSSIVSLPPLCLSFLLPLHLARSTVNCAHSLFQVHPWTKVRRQQEHLSNDTHLNSYKRCRWTSNSRKQQTIITCMKKINDNYRQRDTADDTSTFTTSWFVSFVCLLLLLVLFP